MDRWMAVQDKRDIDSHAEVDCMCPSEGVPASSTPTRVAVNMKTVGHPIVVFYRPIPDHCYNEMVGIKLGSVI